MVGINKNKHEDIIRRLEELKTYSNDPDKIRKIEMEIDSLSEIYEEYLFHIHGLRAQSESYDSLYNDIRKITFKELRMIKYTAKRSG